MCLLSTDPVVVLPRRRPHPGEGAAARDARVHGRERDEVRRGRSGRTDARAVPRRGRPHQEVVAADAAGAAAARARGSGAGTGKSSRVTGTQHE